MLLAGEMLKNFFENVLLPWEILKKFKMLKMGGENYVCAYKASIHKHGPPIFNMFNFFRISQARSTFSKKFLTFPQPEAHNPPKNAPTGEMLKVGFSLFNISPARSTFPKMFLTFPQPEAHNPPKKRSHWGNVKSWFFTF